MTKEQKNAILCAYLDLRGALDAHDNLDPMSHDWKAHRLTIAELVEAFPFLEDEDAIV
jgi:hypothetical protein